jgi:hypothetical protein
MAPEIQKTLTSLGADACIADDAHYDTRFQALQVIAGRGDPSDSGRSDGRSESGKQDDRNDRPRRFIPVAAAG